MTKPAPPRNDGDAAPARRPRSPDESFHAQRRGAQPPEEKPPPQKELSSARIEAMSSLGDAASAAGREKTSRHQRFQTELEQAPLARGLRLRLDYADDGVSRIHLPGVSPNTEPGPLEGGVVGTLCVAAGHFAAASIAPTVGIRLVEFKVNILGVVQGDLLAIGEVVRKGRTLVACRIEIVEDNDRVVAVGLVTYLLQQT